VLEPFRRGNEVPFKAIESLNIFKTSNSTSLLVEFKQKREVNSEDDGTGRKTWRAGRF
jgi:hypothetical protein